MNEFVEAPARYSDQGVLMELIYRVDHYFLLPLMAVLFIVSAFVGYHFGDKRRLAGDATAQVGTLQGAALGLLALLLGFSFAMASARYDERRALVVDEANAIGTLWLRTDLLPPAQAEISRTEIRQYVKSRLAYYRAGVGNAVLDKAVAASGAIQTQLWTQAMQAYGQNIPDVRLNLYTQALNDVIDLSEKRLSALENRVPQPVLILMLSVGIVGMTLVGYGIGLSHTRQRFSTIMIGLVFATVITAILDMDHPRRGLIQVSQNAMLRLDASLNPPSATTAPNAESAKSP